MDWAKVWEFAWPVLKQGLIALLTVLLALLGYDKMPSRYVRSGDKAVSDAAATSKRRAA